MTGVLSLMLVPRDRRMEVRRFGIGDLSDTARQNIRRDEASDQERTSTAIVSIPPVVNLKTLSQIVMKSPLLSCFLVPLSQLIPLRSSPLMLCTMISA